MDTTEVTAAFSELSDFVTGTAAPAILGIAVVGVIIRVALRYVKRAGGQS